MASPALHPLCSVDGDGPPWAVPTWNRGAGVCLQVAKRGKGGHPTAAISVMHPTGCFRLCILTCRHRLHGSSGERARPLLSRIPRPFSRADSGRSNNNGTSPLHFVWVRTLKECMYRCLPCVFGVDTYHGSVGRRGAWSTRQSRTNLFTPRSEVCCLKTCQHLDVDLGC
jgi:hypothetical protein